MKRNMGKSLPLCLVLLAGSLGATLARAQDESGSTASTTSVGPIVRIEQDWVLVVKSPDAEQSSPQVATQMNLDEYGESFAIFSINFQQVPSFWPGGMEIQLWDGEEVVDVDAFAAYELDQPNETIQWTQVLEIKNGTVRFYIKTGQSASFGSFGGTTFSVDRPTAKASFDSFKVADTLKNSGILFGANRVKSFKLVETRLFDAQNRSQNDSEVKIIYEDEEE